MLDLSYRRLAASGVASLISLATLPAAAQTTAKDDFLALGIVSVPEYEGSADQQIVPLVFGQLTFAGGRYIAIEGTGARFNALASQKWAAGPIVNVGFARDDGVDNEVIANLTEVDTAIEVGGFVSRQWSQVGHPSGIFSIGTSFAHDVTGAHDGWQARLSAGYGRNFGRRLRITADTSVTYADDNYVSTYFGITETDTVNSGLTTFEAEGGIKDYGVSAMVNYQLSDSWSVVGYASLRRFTGDASDSPVVTEEGDENQMIFALGLGYAF